MPSSSFFETQPIINMSGQTKELQMQGIESFIDAIAERLADKMNERMKQNAPKQVDDLITRKQAVEMLHVTVATLWRWEHMGIIKAQHLGRRVYYSRSELESAMKENN